MEERAMASAIGVSGGSVPYFPADLVLLLVKRPLLGLGDVAAVRAGHRPFFHPNPMILLVQLGCLPSADLAFAHFLVDPAVLIGKARIDFGTARVRLRPLTIGRCGGCLGESGAGGAGGAGECGCDQRAAGHTGQLVHGFKFSGVGGFAARRCAGRRRPIGACFQ